MAISPHTRYEDELMVKATVSGLISLGGYVVGILVNPILGVAVFVGSGRIFLKTIDTPNPHA
ncbi:MAG TPA: hypothetical protein VF996_03145 [Candidatus Saccharimonadales bacterium]|jgi:hypothetical protein